MTILIKLLITIYTNGIASNKTVYKDSHVTVSAMFASPNVILDLHYKKHYIIDGVPCVEKEY
jgi:hypothetical protein